MHAFMPSTTNVAITICRETTNDGFDGADPPVARKITSVRPA
jgi:hypothetical protein